jgi:translation initiation factor IF-3
MTDVRKKTPGMQQWHKGPRRETAATRQQVNKGPKNKTATARQDREDIRGVRQEGFRTGVREASNRDVLRVAETEELDLVEGSAPPERKIKDWTLWRGRPPSKRKKNLLGGLA